MLAITMQSCFDSDDYDFDKLSEKADWTPNMIVPVGYGTYSLWYLLNQHEETNEQTITLDGEGLLHIKYLEEDIFNYNAADVLNFPSQSPENFSLLLPLVGLPGPISISTATDEFYVQTGHTGVILSELDLNTSLQFYFTNPLNADIDLTVSLPTGTQGGTMVSQTFRINANAANQSETMDLTNLNLFFKTPYSTNNALDLEFSGTILDNGGTISGIGDLGIQYQVQNIDFILAQGDFGTQTIGIGTGNIDMDVDFWDDIEGEYQFADPKIFLYMDNSVGVPFQINANIVGFSVDGNAASLNPVPLQPNYPQNLNEVYSGVSDTVVYDKTNSNIVELMALPPSDRMDYLGSIALNPNVVDIPTSPNILSNNSTINVDIEIDIPLDFTATNLMLRDTIDDIDIDDAEKILNAAVVISAENGYPLDATIHKIYLTDAYYNIIDSVTDNEVIDAAKIFPAGHAQEGEVDPSSILEVSHEIQLSQSQIENLNQTENLIVNAYVSTMNNGESVKLKGDYELKFTISVQAQLDFNN